MTARIVLFLGVSTSGSSILRIFPRWMDVLGIDAAIRGIDLPLDAPNDAYRAVVEEIAATPDIAGAVITTHKLRVFEAASDLFVGFDRSAVMCREVNCIAKRREGLIGFASDPRAATATLRSMLPANHWRATDGRILCLGAGGAATAIALALLCRVDEDNIEPRPEGDRPACLTFVDVREERIGALAAVIRSLDVRANLEMRVHAHPAQNDALMASLPPGSLIINATGMGKDRPGSPITDRAVFPPQTIVWDLNYRGPLDFLRQARMQGGRAHLAIHDGWQYFLHGWTQTLSEILSADLTGDCFHTLSAIASKARS